LGERELNLIFWAAWDSIGYVPRDEYDWYVPQIASLLRSGAGEDEIEKKLHERRTDRIGVGPDRTTDDRAAAKIVEWYTNRSTRDIIGRPT
jgi:hypothetical protein